MLLSVLILLAVEKAILVKGDLAQTSATCQNDFIWMGTRKGVSPCQVAASLDALCNAGSWVIPAVNASSKYSNPKTSDGTASLCTCSWASYNLISACSTCQGYESFVSFWSDYISDCTGKTSDTYWPAKITISTDITIPYWAAIDPTKWTNQKFNSAEAKNYTDKADITPATPTNTSSPSSTPVGAIVGAIIGGLIVIVGFIIIVFWLVRRHRQQCDPNYDSSNPDSRNTHIRKISNTTVDSGMGTLTTSSPFVQHSINGNGQMNNSSASSLPYFQTRINHDGRTIFAPARQVSLPQLRPEEQVTPYTLPPTHEHHDRKLSDGEWPVFDSPSPPPHGVRMEVSSSQRPPRRQLYNPPAYSESDPASPTSHITRHMAQESIDSSLSTPDTSSLSSTIQRRPTHTPANSGSSQGHLPMSAIRSSVATMHTTVSSAIHTSSGFSSQQSHGRSLGTRRSDLRRQDSISPSDIA